MNREEALELLDDIKELMDEGKVKEALGIAVDALVEIKEKESKEIYMYKFDTKEWMCLLRDNEISLMKKDKYELIGRVKEAYMSSIWGED